ncbi:large envelope protein [Striga asiatica]|uniref:Large envelope protein n=1 Tax=Striga asiatica TaxID=4170 RepID=A0A5A7RHH8_STRAF|nr:large envelope protein [Striga asiatica]
MRPNLRPAYELHNPVHQHNRPIVNRVQQMKNVPLADRLEKLDRTPKIAFPQPLEVNQASVPQKILLRHTHQHPIAAQSGQKIRIGGRVQSDVIRPLRVGAEEIPQLFGLARPEKRVDRDQARESEPETGPTHG